MQLIFSVGNRRPIEPFFELVEVNIVPDAGMKTHQLPICELHDYICELYRSIVNMGVKKLKSTSQLLFITGEEVYSIRKADVVGSVWSEEGTNIIEAAFGSSILNKFPEIILLFRKALLH